MAHTGGGNLEAGAPVVGEVNPMAQFCFGMGIRRSARFVSGNWGWLREMEASEQVLTSCDLTHR